MWLRLIVTTWATVAALVGLVIADVFMVNAYRQEDYPWMVFEAVLAAVNCLTLGLNGWFVSMRLRSWWAVRRARRRWPHG